MKPEENSRYPRPGFCLPPGGMASATVCGPNLRTCWLKHVVPHHRPTLLRYGTVPTPSTTTLEPADVVPNHARPCARRAGALVHSRVRDRRHRGGGAPPPGGRRRPRGPLVGAPAGRGARRLRFPSSKTGCPRSAAPATPPASSAGRSSAPASRRPTSEAYASPWAVWHRTVTRSAPLGVGHRFHRAQHRVHGRRVLRHQLEDAQVLPRPPLGERRDVPERERRERAVPAVERGVADAEFAGQTDLVLEGPPRRPPGPSARCTRRWRRRARARGRVGCSRGWRSAPARGPR